MYYNVLQYSMSQIEVEVGKVRCDTIFTIVQYLQNKAKKTRPH